MFCTLSVYGSHFGPPISCSREGPGLLCDDINKKGPTLSPTFTNNRQGHLPKLFQSLKKSPSVRKECGKKDSDSKTTDLLYYGVSLTF